MMASRLRLPVVFVMETGTGTTRYCCRTEVMNALSGGSFIIRSAQLRHFLETSKGCNLNPPWKPKVFYCSHARRPQHSFPQVKQPILSLALSHKETDDFNWLVWPLSSYMEYLITLHKQVNGRLKTINENLFMYKTLCEEYNMGTVGKSTAQFQYKTLFQSHVVSLSSRRTSGKQSGRNAWQVFYVMCYNLINLAPLQATLVSMELQINMPQCAQHKIPQLRVRSQRGLMQVNKWKAHYHWLLEVLSYSKTPTIPLSKTSLFLNL